MAELILLERWQLEGPGIPSGKWLRFRCPLHKGADSPTSLSLNPETGFFKCFACGAVGQLKEKRDEWVEQQRRLSGDRQGRGWHSPRPAAIRPWTPQLHKVMPKPEPAPRPELEWRLRQYQAQLPDSLGEQYLAARGIPLDLARGHGLGYARPGQWPQPKADRENRQRDGQLVARWGRVIVPHLDPAGQLVNLYGRAVELEGPLPKGNRHDHLHGLKGNFNAPALNRPTVILCEGAMDALALLAAGYPAVAVFGPDGLRWGWVKARRVILAFDTDKAGQAYTTKRAREGVLLGKEVFTLGPDTYHGHKDLNAAWAATGRLDLGPLGEDLEERAAILEAEGLPRDEAERRALGLE